MAHHGDRIGVRGNDPHAVSELVAQGAEVSILLCFALDTDPRFVRVASPIGELYQEQWLVSHHDDRHRPEVRRVATRIVRLMHDHGPLFRGEQCLP